MSIESISNTVSYADYKPEQKVPQVTATAGVNPIGTEVTDTTGKTFTGKQESKEEEKQKETQENRLKGILKETNNKIKISRTECEFSYHKEINRVSIKILDTDTKEVIREIPPEETLEMIQKLWEVAGLLVDEKR
ncbi:flagellar protein FlaG [Anaerocolumna sp. MB42-C2]|uniref:flagellar protein FlaG n=1 Tax=Anaerocolumna sp. MB42-C2 TaxID=3070997 RepID=UPI0027E1238D|nr:flagellar protein FlaG [Anaerocolumna sp. MB42-C2]WMJ90232.1 flagellar protein FlaG [Anaerocolumna sp. MB42-C2]